MPSAPTLTVPSFKDVVTTYCGLTGCACGCGGTYVNPQHSTEYTDRRAVSDSTAKRRLNRLILAFKANPDSVAVYDGLGDQVIYEYIYGDYDRHGDRRVIRVYARRNSNG